MSKTYTIGLDFGTNSARALIVRVSDGKEIANAVAPYASGQEGILLDEKDHLLARQNPMDYEKAFKECVREAIKKLEEKKGEGARDQIVGIGVCATVSTPLPLDAKLQPVAAQFPDNHAAQAWLWKDHTSYKEAEEITKMAAWKLPHYLERIGGTYSSEWSLAKLLRFVRRAPKQVVKATAAWVEIGDYITAMLIGCTDPEQLPRNVGAAGHKGFYHDEDGWPSEEFCAAVNQKLGDFIKKSPKAQTPRAAGTRAGFLSKDWSKRLGLTHKIPVSMAGGDAHFGSVGAGVKIGRLTKIMGTSGCDMAVHPAIEGQKPPSITGLCGIVKDSILPGYWGLEAGQSGLGDIYAWFVREFTEKAGMGHEDLTALAEKLRPGQSGLLSLDWNNGNRSILTNFNLSGLVIGQTLKTQPFEMYRSLLEATAFGARTIVEHIRAKGVAVDEIVVCGGLTKNAFLMQMYADVLNMPLRLPKAKETCAFGSAIFAAVAATKEGGGHDTAEEAANAMTGMKTTSYEPIKENSTAYDLLYPLYLQLHDAFGGVTKQADLSQIMLQLQQIREKQSVERKGKGGKKENSGENAPKRVKKEERKQKNKKGDR